MDNFTDMDFDVLSSTKKLEALLKIHANPTAYTSEDADKIDKIEDEILDILCDYDLEVPDTLVDQYYDCVDESTDYLSRRQAEDPFMSEELMKKLVDIRDTLMNIINER